MGKNKFSTKMLAVMSILVALEVIIARFGTIRAVIISILADVLGAFLFPVGPYFPGFTLTAALTGLLYGLLLHKSQSLPRVALAVVLQQAVLSLGLNTYWLHILYGMPYVPTLVTRLVQAGIVTAVQLVVIPLIAKTIQQAEKRIST